VLAANQSAESVLLHSDWTAEVILRKIGEIMPFQQPFRADEIRFVLRNERLMVLDLLTHMENWTHDVAKMCRADQSSPPASWEWFFMKAVTRHIRMGVVMVEVNQRFDEVEQWYFNDDLELPHEALTLDTYDFYKKVAWYGCCGMIPRLHAQRCVERFMIDIEAWRMANKRQQAEVSLMRLLFALEAYHRDNGEYPAALDDLRGRYMDELPLDPFSGEAFRYILEEGGFLLYSVGPNGVDEKGRGHNDFPKGDDIRRRMPPQ